MSRELGNTTVSDEPDPESGRSRVLEAERGGPPLRVRPIGAVRLQSMPLQPDDGYRPRPRVRTRRDKAQDFMDRAKPTFVGLVSLVAVAGSVTLAWQTRHSALSPLSGGVESEEIAVASGMVGDSRRNRTVGQNDGVGGGQDSGEDDSDGASLDHDAGLNVTITSIQAEVSADRSERNVSTTSQDRSAGDTASTELEALSSTSSTSNPVGKSDGQPGHADETATISVDDTAPSTDPAPRSNAPSTSTREAATTTIPLISLVTTATTASTSTTSETVVALTETSTTTTTTVDVPTTQPDVNPTGLFRVASVSRGWCIGLSSSVVEPRSCRSTSVEDLRFEAAGGAVRIVVVSSGEVLDVESSSTANNANIIAYAWHGGDNQRWTVNRVRQDYYEIVGVESGKCIDVRGDDDLDEARIVQWTCDQSSSQLWRLRAG